MARMRSDLVPILQGVAEGHLKESKIDWVKEPAACVVLAAKGYPGAPVRGDEIRGIERAEAMPFVSIIHAGTKLQGQQLVADGGRVLNVTGVGADVAEARARAYAAIDMIDWPGGFYRHDIGWRAIAREEAKR